MIAGGTEVAAVFLQPIEMDPPGVMRDAAQGGDPYTITGSALVEGLFRAADEHWVAITVEHEAAAERLRADGVPLEADALAGWIAARSADTVERFFVMRGAAAAAVRRAGEMADAGGPGAGLAVTQGPDGVPVKGLPWMMNGTVAAGRNAAPPLGGDNRAIAVDLLGRDPAEYEQLVAMGILADAPRAA